MPDKSPDPNSPPADGRVVILSEAAGPIARLEDCWNRIGVYGNRSCVELIHHVHCRNCPVYSNAAATILERPVPAEYRRDWSAHFSQNEKRPVPGAISVVLFRIGDEWLALPTGNFQEVVEERRIHSLPHRSDSSVLGVINVRGELLVCVSLARLLGIRHARPSYAENPRSGRLAVAEWGGELIAFPVDEVHGVARFKPEDLNDPPVSITNAPQSFTRGIIAWENRRVACLDEDSVFSTINRNLS